jgi:uncharacterized protein involved in copper resistance
MGGIGQGTSSHALGILLRFEHDIRHLAFYIGADTYYHAGSGSLTQEFDEERFWRQQEAVFSSGIGVRKAVDTYSFVVYY